MQPAPNVVFVKEAPFEIKKHKFEYAGDAKKIYVVVATGDGVEVCQVGDYVLFNNYHEYEFQGDKILKVNAEDVDGVYHA